MTKRGNTRGKTIIEKQVAVTPSLTVDQEIEETISWDPPDPPVSKKIVKQTGKAPILATVETTTVDDRDGFPSAGTIPVDPDAALPWEA